MLLRFPILDCRSSARSGNAFTVAAKHCDSDRTRKRNPAATYRRAFQKSESALDRAGSDGRSRLGHSD
jgi:hypothetical protein